MFHSMESGLRFSKREIYESSLLICACGRCIFDKNGDKWWGQKTLLYGEKTF